MFESMMRADQPARCSFEGELASLIATKQSSRDLDARCALFDALSDLERRAQSAGAPDMTLRKIAEIRFLTGILRESVRPFPIAPLRTVLRARERGDACRVASAAAADIDAV
ncbi:hypothetical protein ABID82_000480 [Methylobacterium sp. PvP062]|uniref:Uncharacterized protein n=1 Tax=Methylobacterium radiotolerans TaxID=31998 RepID=A0ABV2NAB1_9HYPH|nr:MULTISPECIES: hypothetical protein [unclassified Methylobacterium]MBP2493323.1 hypothetical protein [Methylobacterium sp. PvP105]MBP2500304.1 hypothetical protein [Methylobacterium sp. PvP109]MCX7332409.1 hypothetical protein [Hyphomicrobiales bacterium]